MPVVLSLPLQAKDTADLSKKNDAAKWPAFLHIQSNKYQIRVWRLVFGMMRSCRSGLPSVSRETSLAGRRGPSEGRGKKVPLARSLLAILCVRVHAGARSISLTPLGWRFSIIHDHGTGMRNPSPQVR